LLLFIFDHHILSRLSDKADKRVTFIHQTLSRLNEELRRFDSSIYVLHDKPLQAFQRLLEEFEVKAVFANHDYEPYAISRDQEVSDFLRNKHIGFHTFKDQVISEKSEVMKANGSPYTVFTPYSRLWKTRYLQTGEQRFLSEEKLSALLKTETFTVPTLEAMGFEEATLNIFPPQLAEETLINYHQTRDLPSVSGTTQVSVYLRFGL